MSARAVAPRPGATAGAPGPAGPPVRRTAAREALAAVAAQVLAGPGGTRPVRPTAGASVLTTSPPTPSGLGASGLGTPVSGIGGPPVPAVGRSAAEGRAVLPPRVTPVRRMVEAPPAPPPPGTRSRTTPSPAPASAGTSAQDAPATFRSALAHFQSLDRAASSGGRASRGGPAAAPSSSSSPASASPAAAPEVSAMITPPSPFAPAAPPPVPASAFSYRRAELDPSPDLSPDVLDEIVDRVVQRIEERVVVEVERRVHRTSGGVF